MSWDKTIGEPHQSGDQPSYFPFCQTKTQCPLSLPSNVNPGVHVAAAVVCLSLGSLVSVFPLSRVQRSRCVRWELCRHYTIWSFSASGSYELTFLLHMDKGCFVCTAESKTTCRLFPWYSGTAETWQEEKPVPNMLCGSNQPAPWFASHNHPQLQTRKNSENFLSKQKTMEKSPSVPVCSVGI